MKDDFFAIGGIVTLASLLIASLIYVTYQETKTRDAMKVCLDAGYPDVKRIKREFYCIKWEMSSDVVTPLKDLQAPE